jgi:hypothetical protein
MQILTENSEKFEKNIKKYRKKAKKYKIMESLSRALFGFSGACMAGFYIFLLVFFYMKFEGKDYHIYFNGMLFCIAAGFALFISMVICQINTFKLSWADKIYQQTCKYKESGFEPEDLVYWYDADKIHAYITYENSKKDKANEYFRIDDFEIIFDNTEEVVVNLDSKKIYIPEFRKNKSFAFVNKTAEE